ncbi:MAG: DUF2125 domain-containing protein [Alphaproteobacteria bacterium]|nr:DUF2125 domain-containing protein [Alphaproteobacteria bacterium]
MRYSSRFFLYGPFAGLLILTGLVSVHWWSVANAWAERLDRANGHEIAPGVRMRFSEKRLAGFPFRLDVVLKNLRMEVAESGGPIIWTTEEFAAHALSYGRVQMIFESAGRQTISWVAPQGITHRFSFLPGTFRASAMLEQSKLVRFDSEIVDLDGGEFRARDLQLHARQSRDGLDLYLKLDGAQVTAGYAAALGPDITVLLARGRLNRSDMFAPVLAGQASQQQVFERWRQSGGKLGISELTVTRGKERLTFAGELMLDERHDLAGTLRAQNGTTLQFAGNHISRLDLLP